MTNSEAIEVLKANYPDACYGLLRDAVDTAIYALSAQLQRDIPKKPTEATDRAWGIPCKQAVCPNCDCYLGMVHFLGEGKKKVTYCETCGQAIDWSEWEAEHE